MKMKIKLEMDIEGLVILQAALSGSSRRIEDLIREKPEWRRVYEIDLENNRKGKKVLAEAIANS
jgi:hypothetical protein